MSVCLCMFLLRADWSFGIRPSVYKTLGATQAIKMAMFGRLKKIILNRSFSWLIWQLNLNLLSLFLSFKTRLVYFLDCFTPNFPTACATPRRPVRESKEPGYMENGSVLGSLLISWCAFWGEALSIRTLPLIIHKACRIKVCTHTQQMVIKSCILFYGSFVIFLQDLCAFIAVMDDGKHADEKHLETCLECTSRLNGKNNVHANTISISSLSFLQLFLCFIEGEC